MKCELVVLALAVVLGLIHLMMASQAATNERGLKWNLSPRDEPQPPLSVRAARIDRVLQNFKETFPFFVAAVVVVVSSARSGTVSEIGAVTYLVGRIVYAPLMIFGIVGVRSAVWVISCLGIVAILVQTLLST